MKSYFVLIVLFEIFYEGAFIVLKDVNHMDCVKLFCIFLAIVTLFNNGFDFALLIWHVHYLLAPGNYMAGFMPMEDIFSLQVRIVPFAFSL